MEYQSRTVELRITKNKSEPQYLLETDRYSKGGHKIIT